MAEQKIKIPKNKSVIVHGEEIEDVTEVILPSAEKPYWTLIKGEDDLILATGDVSITHSPEMTVTVVGYSKKSQ